MTANLREAIREACRRDEASCMASLVAETEAIACDWPAVQTLAMALATAVRRQRSGASGVDHLMQEYSLSSQEGVALMCLAEALLRIPDKATVDRLIRDKLSHSDWAAHLGGSPSLFVNAATWGLMLTGKLVSTPSHGALGNALTRILAKGGEPMIRKGVDFAMRLLGQQFVMGETIEAALASSQRQEARGYTYSFDMLGEGALTSADAQRYAQTYETAIHAIGQASANRGVRRGPGISVKLSALHPRYVRSQRNRVMAELLPRLKHLAQLAKHYAIGLNLDAEEADRLDLSLDLFEALASDTDLAGWDGLGFVVQAYQKRSPFVVDWLVDLARRQQRRIMVRLVKGAYWDSEIKRAQVDGLSDYPVYTRKAHSDLCYQVCASRLLAASDVIYPQFATHNSHTLATVVQLARERGVEDYEFQCLHGMGEPLYDKVVGAENLGKTCRIYAPVGTHETLLPYLVRRLLENGANSSFVNRIVDDAVPIEELVENPLDRIRREGGGRHPGIALPRDLFGVDRVNSSGIDLADEPSIVQLGNELAALASKDWLARPLVAGDTSPDGPAIPVFNPANCCEPVGRVIEANNEQIAIALAQAAAYAQTWFETPAATRAAALRRAADLFESKRSELISLGLREAGKTWANAVAEIREAVDFCRYYAGQITRSDWPNSERAPGPAVCIAPWNFPLAIFVGEVSAALAAGSPVIAKPAEQTPLIACLAVTLFHQAGIPLEALQFLPGRGETVGAALTADARVRGVVFTGSTEVARLINQSMATRDGVRLIAETGGQNAMIVDSSALPEQVVNDVLMSGFDSAGQRCSSLRVLCLQNDIAERVLAMLKAAMQELVIGDPQHLATDIGPVIDAEARSVLLAHIEAMRTKGKAVFQASLPATCDAGYFVAPTLIEIDAFADLQREVFGPIVHVLRYDGAQLETLIAAINATGYGLTLGLHSRIDETAQRVTTSARVGNIYINRNMVGAVVGVQPFGGEGLSGTGPKAGGPLYLHRLAGHENMALDGFGSRPPQQAGEEERSSFARFSRWAAASAQHDLVGHCAAYAELIPGAAPLELPGPIGEHNTLSFFSRGRLLCLASDAANLLAQLAAVFATGNRAVVIDTTLSRSIIESLPRDLADEIEWSTEIEPEKLAGVLYAGDAEPAAPLRQRLAEAPGALIPVFQAGEKSGRYPLYRMLVERVVCVNTTAAGGNASLMTLDA